MQHAILAIIHGMYSRRKSRVVGPYDENMEVWHANQCCYTLSVIARLYGYGKSAD